MPLIWFRVLPEGHDIAAALERAILTAGSRCMVAAPQGPETWQLMVRSTDRMPGALVLAFTPIAHKTMFESVAEQLPAALCVYDAARRLRWANAAAQRQYYADYPKMLGLPMEELVPEASQRREIHERALQGEPTHIRAAPATPPGAQEPLYFDIDYRGLRGESGVIDQLLVVGTDVTARRKAEIDLRESEERFRGAFDHASIGMALVAPDGRWLRVNASLCRIVGYTAEELLATTFKAITHPDDREVDADFARRVLDGALSHYHREKRYLHKDGHTVWILLSTSLVRGADGEPLYCVAQIQDITARRTAEARLLESELRYRTIVDLAPGFVFEGVLDDGHFLATWASEGFERLHGCTLPAFINLGYARFFDPSAIAQVRASLPELAKGSDVTLELPMRSLDGVEHWIRLVARAFPIEPGRDRSRVLGFGEEITQQKLLEKALEDITHREQRRLGHEIHDGLGQELAGLTYLASSLATRAQRTHSKLAGDLSTLASVASHAIETCRDIARGISPLTESRGSLVESIRRLVERASVGGRARLSFHADEGAPVALSWEARSNLHRIVQEAISNASRHADAQHVRVAIAVDAHSVRVEVIDDGRGFIPSGAASTGLGLGSMRQRAAAIGATLRVEARIGGGAAIICECPQP